MPALPKHPSTRARRNKVAGARTLSVVHEVAPPPLPDEAGIDWHPMTMSWWDDIWASPMAPEFDDSDVHGLYVLAVLMDQYWLEPSSALAAEIRLQRQCFGLTPIDRRRLQWEIERGEQADSSTRRRRNAELPAVATAVEAPPRSASKAAWIDFAVAAGRDRSSAQRMTKDQLVAELGDGKADLDPRAALG